MSKKKPVDGHPAGHRGTDPKNKKGDWWPTREHGADTEHQGGLPNQRRPPIGDNLDEEPAK
jgi:hypothetical protein